MKSVLVADDDIVTQLTLAHILEAEGYRVHLVSNGLDALDYLQRQPIDLLISDITMPGLDGIALLETIRANPSLRELAVILITGTQEQLALARAVRVNGVLTKPVGSWQVLAEVSQALGAASRESEGTGQEEGDEDLKPPHVG